MSLLKIKCLEILFYGDKGIYFEATYTDGSKTFSPKNFICRSEKIVEEGNIYIYEPSKFKIIDFGKGTKNILDKFLKQLNGI